MMNSLRRGGVPTIVTEATEDRFASKDNADSRNRRERNEFAPRENADSRRNLGLRVQGGRDLGEKRINGKVMTVTK